MDGSDTTSWNPLFEDPVHETHETNTKIGSCEDATLYVFYKSKEERKEIKTKNSHKRATLNAAERFSRSQQWLFLGKSCKAQGDILFCQFLVWWRVECVKRRKGKGRNRKESQNGTEKGEGGLGIKKKRLVFNFWSGMSPVKNCAAGLCCFYSLPQDYM